MLLSLVAHTGGYRMMVGAHNTVGCQMHVRGCCLLRVWQTSAPATLLIPGGMQWVFTIFDWYGKCRCPQHCRCPEACGESLTVWELIAPTTLYGKISAPTTLLGLCHAREVAEYCFRRRTGYGPWHCSLTCVHCLTFSVRFLVLTERASPVGWSQSALIALVGEEQ